MKAAAALLVASATLTTLAGASQHNHRHAHLHKKRDVKTVVVAGPVEVEYVFEGNVIPKSVVCEGMNNGTFEWPPGTANKPDCDAPAAPQSPDPSPVPSPSPSPSPSPAASSAAAGGNEFLQSPAASPSPSPSPQSSGGSTSSGGGSTSGGPQLSGFYAAIATNENVAKTFTDGEVDCSTFPSDYGAVPVEYVGLNGWSGIQNTVITNGVPGTITTATSGGCSSDGSGDVYCSYACPAGYMKTQFPDTNSGTSVGGLQCKSDGKLHRTNTGFDTLCTKGAGSATVENNLDDVVCICGTDYPGTEAETVPMCAQGGGSTSLAITDGSNYYKHQGSFTTAQYYVNQKGIAVQDACQWGTDQTSKGIASGNWASVVIGAGQNGGGSTFISLMSTEQNYPEKVVGLGFDIELQGDFGGSSCSYKMVDGVGQFCSQDGCQPQGQFVDGSGSVPGCTVQLFSGVATYKLS